MQKLAASAGFANWKEAQQCIQEVVDAIGQFRPLAEQYGVSKTTVSAIAKTLAERKQENAALLV
jgi:serine/threonine-protein kinase HipA